MKRLALVPLLLLLFAVPLAGQAPAPLLPADQSTAVLALWWPDREPAASAPKAPYEEPLLTRCPACKVIVDYGALQAAAADLEKSTYAAWEALLEGLQSGRLTWEEVGPLAYDACERAKHIRKMTLDMETRIRELSEQPRRARSSP